MRFGKRMSEVRLRQVGSFLVVGPDDPDRGDSALEDALQSITLPEAETGLLVRRALWGQLRRVEARLVEQLSAHLDDDAVVRLLHDQAARVDGPHGPSLAARLSQRLERTVIAPDGELHLADGDSLFSAGLGSVWRRFDAGQQVGTTGPRIPEPSWQAALPNNGLNIPWLSSVMHLPCGLWVRQRSESIVPSDEALAIPVSDDLVSIAVGAPGEGLPSLKALIDVVDMIPIELHDKLLLLPFSGDYQAHHDLAGELADAVGHDIKAAHVMPTRSDAGAVEFVARDTSGSPTWAPLVSVSRYCPDSKPVAWQWDAVVDGQLPPPNATAKLTDGWALDLLPSGLRVRPAHGGFRSQPTRAVDADTVDLEVAAGGDARPITTRVLKALADLLPQLPAETRDRVRLVATDDRRAGQLSVFAAWLGVEFELQTADEPSDELAPAIEPAYAGVSLSAALTPLAALAPSITAPASPHPTAVLEAVLPSVAAVSSCTPRISPIPVTSPARLTGAVPLGRLCSASVVPASNAIRALAAPAVISDRNQQAAASPGNSPLPQPLAEMSEGDDAGQLVVAEALAEPVTDIEAAPVAELLPEPARAPDVLVAARAWTDHRSSETERQLFRGSLGWRYDSASRFVTRLLSQRPGLRAVEGDQGVATDLAAVHVFASGDNADLLDAIRDDMVGDDDAAFVSCVVGGLRRLPSLAGPVRRADMLSDLDPQPGDTIVEPIPLRASSDLSIPSPGSRALIWSSTARQIDGLVDTEADGQVMFLPGTTFQVLDVDRTTTPALVLLAENPAPLTGRLDERRVETMLRRLRAVAPLSGSDEAGVASGRSVVGGAPNGRPTPTAASRWSRVPVSASSQLARGGAA